MLYKSLLKFMELSARNPYSSKAKSSAINKNDIHLNCGSVLSRALSVVAVTHKFQEVELQILKKCRAIIILGVEIAKVSKAMKMVVQELFNQS